MHKRILSILLFSVLCGAASAQSVGLVLSGGGAKGTYHVGVMKALEENNIPIDYVSGTSIGAIVGGLYAIGYTPDEIGEVLKSPEVMNWITGKIDNRYSYYFKQMRQSAAMITMRVDPAKRRVGGSQLPNNLVSSDQLDLAFAEFFGAVDVVSDGDFDNLMIPFRCLATDAKGSRPVVFSKGELAPAVRASMSIPFLFAPLKMDDMVLFDGGMFNNFPWQPLMEDFEPGVLIGSSCTAAYLEGNDANLMEQAFMVTMLHTDFTLPREHDVMVERMFPNISMMDFDKADFLIESGYADAMARMDDIKRSVKRRLPADELAARREEFRSRIPELILENIEITGLTEKQEEYVKKLLRVEKDEMPYGFDEFRSEFFKILAEGDIDGDLPRVRYDEKTGYFTLRMDMATKPSLKVMFGGNISSTALNQAYVGLEYKKIGSAARSHNLDGNFSAFHTSVALDNRVDFFIGTPFYAELGGQINFYNYFRSNYGFLVKGEDVTYSKYRDHYLTAAIGVPTSRHTVLNARLNYGQDEYLYHLAPGLDDNDKMDRTRFRFMAVKVEFDRRNMNYILYPTKGVSQQLSAIYVNGREWFNPALTGGEKLSAKRQWFGGKFSREQYFHKWGKWFSMGYLIEGVTTNRPNFVNEYAANISAPAFQPTQHSKIVYMKEFRANSYAAAGLMPIFHFGQNLYLKTSGYLFLPSSLDGVKDNIRQRLRYIFDASLVYQTMLGPVSLSVSQYDTKSNNWFITFNFGTALFNPKGFYY